MKIPTPPSPNFPSFRIGSPNPKKVKRTDFSCAVSAPPVRGRRKFACRICGYTVNPKSTDVTDFTCCDKVAHRECWKNASLRDALVSKPSCSKIYTFLNKDRKTPRESWVTVPSAATQVSDSTTQGAPAVVSNLMQPPSPESLRNVNCEYCGSLIGIDDKNHYMETCIALNKLSEPYSRPESGAVELTPYATRMASMTLVRPPCTPRRRRGRVKQRQGEQPR